MQNILPNFVTRENLHFFHEESSRHQDERAEVQKRYGLTVFSGCICGYISQGMLINGKLFARISLNAAAFFMFEVTRQILWGILLFYDYATVSRFSSFMKHFYSESAAWFKKSFQLKHTAETPSVKQEAKSR